MMLELKDVHTYYGNIHALKGISLTVDKGEIVTSDRLEWSGQEHHAPDHSGYQPAAFGNHPARRAGA